jgi:hypothetical protein
LYLETLESLSETFFIPPIIVALQIHHPLEVKKACLLHSSLNDSLASNPVANILLFITKLLLLSSAILAPIKLHTFSFYGCMGRQLVKEKISHVALRHHAP